MGKNTIVAFAAAIAIVCAGCGVMDTSPPSDASHDAGADGGWDGCIEVFPAPSLDAKLYYCPPGH